MTREEAIKYGKEQLEIFGGMHRKFITMAIEALQAEPVKHGEWRKAYRKTANGVDFLVLSCSECDNADPQMNYYDFCPNCGAKMDKD